MVKIRKLVDLAPGELAALMRRAEANIEAALGVAREVIYRVGHEGDDALLEYVRRFDYAGAAVESFKVREDEFAAAHQAVPPELARAIADAHRNIVKFHTAQLPRQETWFVEIRDGVFGGEKVTPIPSAGLYVPRGKGAFPSVMLMLAVPAVVAGVPQVVVVTPPNEQGRVDAATLVAARLCGVEHVYKMGGAQAVAALALGTATVPRVAKIIGPGSIYASAAKRLLFGRVDVGLPAGPSEAIVLADEHADPRVATLELLNEAEHGPDSASLLVTHDEALARKVAELVPGYLAQLPEWRRAFCEKVLSSYGGIVLTENLESSIQFVNDYAPEHLAVLVRDPHGILGKLHNAGEILLGPYTPIAFGNYCLGTNAILPTGGFARTYSGVSVHDFLKRTGVGYVTARGFAALKETTTTLADSEGFPAHALAIRAREGLL